MSLYPNQENQKKGFPSKGKTPHGCKPKVPWWQTRPRSRHETGKLTGLKPGWSPLNPMTLGGLSPYKLALIEHYGRGWHAQVCKRFLISWYFVCQGMVFRSKQVKDATKKYAWATCTCTKNLFMTWWPLLSLKEKETTNNSSTGTKHNQAPSTQTLSRLPRNRIWLWHEGHF